MVNQELIDNIVARFKQGEHSAQIKEDLIEEGYTTGDIDAAFRHIRYAALQQIPVFAKFTQWLEELDAKTADLPPRQLLIIFAVIGLIILLTAGSLYLIFDPLGTRAAQRDQEREQAFVQLHNAIEKYNTEHHAYPKQLNDLVPNYISNVPVDPHTKIPYDYKILDTAGNYQLCASFETQNSQCVASKEETTIPVVTGDVPAATDDSETSVTLNGKVYTDTNKDAKPDPDEAGLEKVSVIVKDSADKQVCSTTTDNDGIFMCTLSVQGDYSVSVAVPDGMKATQENPIKIAVPDKNNPITKAATVYFGIAPVGQSPVKSTPGKAIKK